MAASGQITSGYWPAMLIGVLLLLTFVATTTAAVMRGCWMRRREIGPQSHRWVIRPIAVGHRTLVTEALIVRQRLSGEIDAETYQTHMNELARQAISVRRPQRNT